MAIKYVEKLTSTLVTESGNPLFYEGNVIEGEIGRASCRERV